MNYNNLTVGGNMIVGRNLTVEGWLDARNIKSPCKGLFASYGELLEAYPYPRPGWWALVGDSLPAQLYQVRELEWQDTGNQWDLSSLALDAYDKQIQTLEEAIARVHNLFEPYIVNDGETTLVTTSETITREVEVADDGTVVVDPGTTNLFDLDDLLYGYDISSGKVRAVDGGIMSNLVEVTPGETYTIENVCYYSDNVYIAFYDSSGTYIGRLGFAPTTIVEQGTTSSGKGFGCAVLTTIVCPDTVDGSAYTHCRVVMQAVLNTGTAYGDIENARMYVGTEWKEPTYSDGTHTETITETITTTKEVTGERLDLTGVCQCNANESNSASSSADDSPTIRILSIGNSYSRDSLAYLPFVMPEIAGVKTQIGILYQGACTLDTHYSNATGGTAAYTLDYNKGDGSAWSQTSGYTIARALALQEWDIILLQQASTSAYTATTYSKLNSLIDLIAEAVTYPVKFGWLLTQARPSTLSHAEIEANFLAAAEIAESLLETSPIEMVIPAGTAVQNARGTTLSTLGEGGQLVASDLVHLQEGLPCMIATYAAALSISQLCGRGYHSILGSPIRATATWLATKNIPEPNGSVIEGSDAQYLIAQKCAIMAHKFPFSISMI